MNKVTYTSIRPTLGLNLLSQEEIFKLSNPDEKIHQLFRACALAVLNTDNMNDDAESIFETFADFDIQLKPHSRGIRLEIYNAPAQSFVDGEIIFGIKTHLSAVLRDIIYTEFKVLSDNDNNGITDKVFTILRNAGIVQPNVPPKLVVCWGGHSIPREEYDYAKHVGYQLGLRDLNIITGCGIGAMKGPMKGAAVGHAKQQITDGRYIGITEPGIIASESPNAIVNQLVIMPDIEKRLEAFVRLGHCIIVFPGGVGTVEEILYLLSILAHPENKAGVPLIFAGPESCRGYFEMLDKFLRTCLGNQIANYYQIIIGDPEKTGHFAKEQIRQVHHDRRTASEAYYFNWNLHITAELQKPFIPTHENMAALNLDPALPTHKLASNLRSAFSGIVAGNVKAFGIRQVAEHGPYQLKGSTKLMNAIDHLLRAFVKQKRMKLGEDESSYTPCYEIKA
jgi:hypothetical protein